MGSFYEELALNLFSVKTGIKLARKHMKQFILEQIDPNKERRKDYHLITAISELKRTPDAVSVLTPDEAEALSLDKIKTVLFCEAEHSNPITEDGLFEYAELFDMLEDDYGFNIALVVIEKYGRYQFVDLEALYYALVPLMLKE